MVLAVFMDIDHWPPVVDDTMTEEYLVPLADRTVPPRASGSTQAERVKPAGEPGLKSGALVARYPPEAAVQAGVFSFRVTSGENMSPVVQHALPEVPAKARLLSESPVAVPL